MNLWGMCEMYQISTTGIHAGSEPKWEEIRYCFDS